MLLFLGLQYMFLNGKKLNRLFKIIMPIAILGLLWYELNAIENPDQLWRTFLIHSGGSDLSWLLATLLLMPLNPAIETQKWCPIVQQYEDITWFQAFKAVLAGSTLAIFSPNRIGEYGGRILFISSGNRWKALMAHVAGGMAQFMALTVFGMIGTLWVLKKVLNISDELMGPSIIVALIGIVATVLIYFNFGKAIPIARRIPWLHSLKRYVKDVSILEHFSRAELGRLLGWSALRYGISCCQYYFLLKFFGIETGLLNGFACISGLFLFQTLMPLPPVASFFARGNIAIWIWGVFGANQFSSLAATFLLWIINLFLPAFIGTFSIFYVNITRAIGYENE